MHDVIRTAAAGAAVLLAAVALSIGLVEASRTVARAPAGRPEPPGSVATPAEAASEPAADPRAYPAVERALLREAERQEEERWLRRHLGGLAALVLDPPPAELAACIPPERVEVGRPGDPDEVARSLPALRGLEFEERIAPELLPPGEMARRVAESFRAADDPEALEVEARVLVALGAITPDVDLRHVRVEAFAEQVSGLYSGGRDEVLLRVDGEGGDLSPLERVVLAHEYEHALTHQRLGRPAETRAGHEDADERRASQAVVEGSATLAMLQFSHAALDSAERVELRRELVARAREGALEGHTPYLIAELQYPYTEGLALACERYAAGGWDAVDAEYADPPDSSLEVLLPERFPGGADPVAPPELRRPGGGWRQVAAEVFGAADLLWLLEAPNGDAGAALPRARERVAGWRGGRLVAWADGDRTVVGLALAQRSEAPSLCAALLAWRSAGWRAEAERAAPGTRLFTGAGRAVAVRCDGDGVRLAVAPGSSEALAVVGH